MPNEGYEGIWGWADDFGSLFCVLAAASNVIVGTNPPYSVTDFLSIYPNFGGTPITFTATVDGATGDLTAVSSIAGLLSGQYVTGQGIPSGTTISSAQSTIFGNVVVLNHPTTIAGSPVLITAYAAPLVPTAVMNAYINLASASIIQARWQEMWPIAMALYIAHFLTLWLRSQSGGANPTAAAVAESGLAFGIKTSKAAGDVSVGSEAIMFEGYGAWNLTVYGLELITWASVIGSGNLFLW